MKISRVVLWSRILLFCVLRWGSCSRLQIQSRDGEYCWNVFDKETIGLVKCSESTTSSLFAEVAGGYVEHYLGARLESLSIPGMCLAPATDGYMIQNYRYSVHRGSSVSMSWCLTECVRGSCGGSILNGNVMLLNTCSSRASTWINRGPHLINAETGNCLQLCEGSDASCAAGEWSGVNVKAGECKDRGTMQIARSPSPMALQNFNGIVINPHSGSSRCLDTCLETSESGSKCNMVGDRLTTNYLRAGLVGRNVFGQSCGAYAAGHNQAWKWVPHSYSRDLKLIPCDDLLVGHWTMRASRMMLVGGELEPRHMCVSNDGIGLKLSDCNNRTVNVWWNMQQLKKPKPSPSPSEDSAEGEEEEEDSGPPSTWMSNGLGPESPDQETLPLASQKTNAVKSGSGSSRKSIELGVVFGLIGAAVMFIFFVSLGCCYCMRRRKNVFEENSKDKIAAPMGIKIEKHFPGDITPPGQIRPTTYSAPLLPQSTHNANYLVTNPMLMSLPAVSRNNDSNLNAVLGDMNNLSSYNDDLTGVLDALNPLIEDSTFADRYVMECERIIGRSGVVCFATNKFSKESVAIKFYSSDHNFQKAKEVHRVLSAPHFCKMEDAIDKTEDYPPALVFEKGDYTLSDFLAKTRPNSLSQKLALSQILEALVELHRQRVVHRDLKPTNIMWFSKDHMWKLVDLDTCVPLGTPTSVTYTPLYAPPEAIKAQEEASLETNADMWSFGIIAFEVLSGERFYGPQASLATVLGAISSEETLPKLDCISELQAKRFISNLVCLDPRRRWSAMTVLQNAFFRSGEDTMQQQSRWNKVTEQLNKICELVEITAEEVRASNMMASITMEYFKSKSNPLDPFHLREVGEVCSISDDNIPNQPVHLLNIGSPYRLHISLAHDYKVQVPIDAIRELKLTPPDGEGVVLETQRVPSNQAFEFVAFWDPNKHNSQRLKRAGSGFGGVREKYVMIEVSITYEVKGQAGKTHDLKGKLFCQIYPSGSKFRLQRFTRVFHKAWGDAPQWMRDAAKGTVLLTTVAVNAIAL